VLIIGKYVTSAIGDYRRPAKKVDDKTDGKNRGRIKTLPFTIQTFTVFDGKSLLGKACFMRLSGHQQVSRSLTVKAVKKPEENLDADRRCTAKSEA
jgi:hypothetical protein